MGSWLQTLAFQVTGGDLALRAVTVSTGGPYRPDPSTQNADRTPDAVALSTLLAALEAAGLRCRRRWRGVDVLGRDRRVMPVRVRDTARIIPAEMRCGTQAPELLLDLGLALVPVFGPLLVDVPFAGSLLVDGLRDRRELGQVAARTVQEFGRRIAKHAPIAVPLLLDRARRMREP